MFRPIHKTYDAKGRLVREEVWCPKYERRIHPERCWRCQHIIEYGADPERANCTYEEEDES